MEYTIASADTIVGLIEEVNTLIANGWKPLGGVSLTAVPLSTIRFEYVQAMVKD